MSLRGPIRRLLGEEMRLRKDHFRRERVHSERRLKRKDRSRARDAASIRLLSTPRGNMPNII
jgi:hypothetical protein